MGAALFAWHQLLDNQRNADDINDSQTGSFLGPSYSDDEIQQFLDSRGYPYNHVADGDLTATVADLIAQGKVVGWFQGRMEFGPRALGSRSIIGDARNPQMQAQMNLKIKYRESFRPFAPSVLMEEVNRFFELDRPSPYMLLVAYVDEEQKAENVYGRGTPVGNR